MESVDTYCSLLSSVRSPTYPPRYQANQNLFLTLPVRISWFLLVNMLLYPVSSGSTINSGSHRRWLVLSVTKVIMNIKDIAIIKASIVDPDHFDSDPTVRSSKVHLYIPVHHCCRCWHHVFVPPEIMKDFQQLNKSIKYSTIKFQICIHIHEGDSDPAE